MAAEGACSFWFLNWGGGGKGAKWELYPLASELVHVLWIL